MTQFDFAEVDFDPYPVGLVAVVVVVVACYLAWYFGSYLVEL